MPRLIGLTGPARSGKSTVAEILRGHGFEIFSFADPLKSAVNLLLTPLGVSVTDHLLDESRKEMEIEGLGVSPRYLWQTLGTEWGRERVRADFWIKLLEARIERERRYQWLPQVAIADVRFANEAHWVANQPAGEVWRIVRPGCEAQARNHASEQGIPPEFITAGIVNDGDIAQLAARVGELLR